MPSPKKPSSPSRRHFLTLTAAVASRAAVAATAIAATTLPARAMGKIWWGGHHRGGGKHPYCFLPETRILTPDGELTIESLRIGDLVQTMRGVALPIKWIGRHVYKKSGASWHSNVMPICVLKGAIDDRTPHTDLYLSPWHALLIDGHLMPVKDLVNGISIAPAVPSDTQTLEYFQIVFDTHEVIWAQGAPAETLLVETSHFHEAFTNFAEYERLYPHDTCPVMTPYAPRVTHSVGRDALKALVRRGVSNIVDLRDPLQRAQDRIAARALEIMA